MLTRIACLLVICLVLVLSPASGLAQEYDETCGDDVLIATDESFLNGSPSMDIAENGDIYIAVAAYPAAGPEIRVYRSQDAGDTWPLWGTIALGVAPAVAIDSPCLHIGEGTENRVYVAYRFRGPSDSNFSIRVAASQLAVPAASWTLSEAMAQSGVDFQSPSLDSDEMSNADYGLYLVAMGSGIDGSDVWFCRSTDFNGTWGGEYRIFSSTSGDGYFFPEVRYGRNGVIHCVCYFRPITTPDLDYAVRYRRAQSYAASGILSWQSIVEMTSDTDGSDEYHASVAASHASDLVAVGYARRDAGGQYQPAEYRLSTDAGATWPPELSHVTPDNHLPHLLANDAHNRFYVWGALSGTDNYGYNYLTYDLALASPHWSHMDRPYTGVQNTQVGGRYFDYNASKGNRAGYVWMTWNSSGADSLFFDAHWRTDPGYPNIAPGFPVALSSGVVAPPALCEIDGDPQSEIVFGTSDGMIQVYNHDGTVVAGWPVDIGSFHADATIAVGDITGDASCEVVAGNSTGVAHAFTAAGVPLAGWPRALNAGYPAYLAIGAISTAQQQVVTCCGNKVHLINGDGSVAPNFPMESNTPVSAPPALGDVDDDGDRDIVILQLNIMNVLTGEGTVQAVRGFESEGKTFSNAPTLADLDQDGDLEIAAPTDQGDLYVMHGDGSDVSGLWPYHGASGASLTSAALVNLQNSLDPQVVVNEESPAAPMVHCFSASGMEFEGYPRPTAPGWSLLGMPIADWCHEGTDVFVASRADDVRAWTDDGEDLPGWPKWLGARHNVSPASGDIDADDRLEIVYTSFSPPQLTVVDVGSYAFREEQFATWWWPMYGYNALRQGCLACGGVVTGVAGDSPPASRARFAPPAPNPSNGSVALHFELTAASAVRLDAFDVNGRLVSRVLKAELPAGPHDVTWDGLSGSGERVAAGSYYLRLSVNRNSGMPALTRRVAIVR